MKPIQSRIFLVSLIHMNEKFSLSKCQYLTKVGHISIEIFMIKKFLCRFTRCGKSQSSSFFNFKDIGYSINLWITDFLALLARNKL